MRLRVRKSSWDRFLESKNGIVDHEDVISKLPETVLHHMISFLPSSDSDQVRLLSRKWRRLSAQNQKKLFLTGSRLNEHELSKILDDDFHSVEFLTLRNCPLMKNLRLVNFKLKIIELNYCGSLKNIELNTPDLEIFRFHGPRCRPCLIDFSSCKKIKILHLVGVSMNNMFKDCNKTFPFLKILTLSGCDCDTTGCINILSNSLERLSLLRFQNSIQITVDGPNVHIFKFNGSTIPFFSNMNLPHLDDARIELNPSRYQKRDKIWFSKLIEMLKGLKHTERLEFHSSSDKNIIIPKQLRETFVPLLDGLIHNIVVTITSRTKNDVDLADAMFWISPRVKRLLGFSDYYAFVLELDHLALSGIPDTSCSFCASHSSRCWRHSVTQYTLSHSLDEGKKKMVSYLKENLQKVGRDATDRAISNQ